MKKQLLMLLVLLFAANITNAQVGINNTDPKSALDITASNSGAPANTDGILIPRIDVFPATDPGAEQHGMMVFLTTADGLDLPGFYYWDEGLTDWVTISVPLRINDLVDGKSDYDGSDNGSSIFLGLNAGANDDGTNNQNIGIGLNSLNSVSTGVANVGVGYNTLSANTSNYNTAVGFQALTTNIGGGANTAIGASALDANTSGNGNAAIGLNSLGANTTGILNTAIGNYSLENNTSGRNNVAIGAYALRMNNANGNTAIGNYSLDANTTGIQNMAIGNAALGANTTGVNNTAIGVQALQLSVTGNRSTAIGTGALNQSNVAGNAENTAIGNNAGYNIVDGIRNVLIGHNTAFDGEGEDNVFVGNSTGYFSSNGSTSTSDQNVFVGHRAGYGAVGNGNVFIGNRVADSIFGDHNVFIGHQAGSTSYLPARRTVSNTLWIENSNSNLPLVYGEFNNSRVGINWNSATAIPQTFSVNGEASKATAGAFVANSDRRLKKEIETISSEKALDLVSQLRGVTYKWNDSETGIDRPEGLQYGFIAQELMEVFPERVTQDGLGFYQTAYGDYDALFVQAFKELKQQLEDKEAKIKDLEKQLENYEQLSARLSLIEAKLDLTTESEKVVAVKD